LDLLKRLLPDEPGVDVPSAALQSSFFAGVLTGSIPILLEPPPSSEDVPLPIESNFFEYFEKILEISQQFFNNYVFLLYSTLILLLSEKMPDYPELFKKFTSSGLPM